LFLACRNAPRKCKAGSKNRSSFHAACPELYTLATAHLAFADRTTLS
jgi:hypothetical protein